MRLEEEEEEQEGSTHPFAALPSVGKHLLQGPDRQGLLQHKVADAQVWRNILAEQKERERSGKRAENGRLPDKRTTVWTSQCIKEEWLATTVIVEVYANVGRETELI